MRGSHPAEVAEGVDPWARVRARVGARVRARVGARVEARVGLAPTRVGARVSVNVRGDVAPGFVQKLPTRGPKVAMKNSLVWKSRQPGVRARVQGQA